MQALLAQIPKGKVTTYAEMAKAMGCPRGARAIGNLLNKNPDPKNFPCCKVVKSNREIGGFTLGEAEKIKRLAAENIEISNGKVVGFKEKLYRF